MIISVGKMKNQLDISFILSVFDKIKKKGKKWNNSYMLEGIEAGMGYDEYTIFLANSQVTLQVFFHNKYQIDYKNKEQFFGFMKNLEAIDRQY
jgi:hypothetical protein